MREIVVDVETTGLNPKTGDRIVEIAALELNNLLPTGKIFHRLVNPQTYISEAAKRLHGFDEDFLRDKPLFKEIAKEFLDFIKQDALVIHNAAFDIGFINAEMKKIKFPQIENNKVIDTLMIARKKFPNLSNSLDSLCIRYKIDLSKREKHSAILDCKLLAKVYLQLKGGMQRDFIKITQDNSVKLNHQSQNNNEILQKKITTYQFNILKATQNEIEKHNQMIENMNKQKLKPIWQRYISELNSNISTNKNELNSNKTNMT